MPDPAMSTPTTTPLAAAGAVVERLSRLETSVTELSRQHAEAVRFREVMNMFHSNWDDYSELKIFKC